LTAYRRPSARTDQSPLQPRGPTHDQLQETLCAALAVSTLGGSFAASTTSAEARGGAIAAGIIGGVALGAIAAQAYHPRTIYVAERRYVRKHRCGCVVHYHVHR
jgi:hypothetical protein